MEDRLPSFVLAELFGNSLVNISKEAKQELTKTEKQPSQKIYLGNYEKKIIVLVNDAANMYLSDNSLQFLTEILNACKLNFAHIALINFNKHAVNFLQLKKEMQPAYILGFGVSALQIDLPFDMPHYQVQQYSNCTITTAPSLDVINQSTQQAKAEKKKLWSSLQKMFDLEK